MAYFINKLQQYANINAKSKELNSWISKYLYVLLPDELAYNDFLEYIKTNVEDMNVCYFRSKPFVVSIKKPSSSESDETTVVVSVADQPNKWIFILSIRKVRGLYEKRVVRKFN